MNAKIGVLSNGGSEKKRRAAERMDLSFARQVNIVHLTTAGESEIPLALERLAGSNIEVLAINGGDGTVAHVITALVNGNCFRQFPRLAILPGGTSNITAGDCGFRGSLTRSTRALCRFASGNLPVQTVRRHPVRVESDILPGPLHGMVFGAGAVVEGIDYWHEQVKSRGLRGPGSSFIAMLGTLRGILGRDSRFSKSVEAQLDWGDERAPTRFDALILLISGLERLFLGIRPYWGQGEGLHCTVVHKQPRHFLRALLPILRGRDSPLLVEENGYQSLRCHQLAVRMSGRFTLDGDLYNLGEEPQTLRVRSGPELQFIRPDGSRS